MSVGDRVGVDSVGKGEGLSVEFRGSRWRKMLSSVFGG